MPRCGDDRESKDTGLNSSAVPDSEPMYSPAVVGLCRAIFVSPALDICLKARAAARKSRIRPERISDFVVRVVFAPTPERY